MAAYRGRHTTDYLANSSLTSGTLLSWLEDVVMSSLIRQLVSVDSGLIMQLYAYSAF